MPAALEQPRDIAPQRKAYAFERSLGIPERQACRNVGGKPENGQATKWEQSRSVQAWISYYRSLGHTDEIMAAKRARIEDRLNLSAFGDIFEFAELVDEMGWDSEAETWKPTGRKSIAIDWAKVMASPLRQTIIGFSFHKDTGKLVDFKREDPESAITQLRDMHGLRAARRTELTGKGGGPVQTLDLTKLTHDQLVQFESLLAAASPEGDAEAGEGGDPAPNGSATIRGGADPAQPSIELPANGR